MFTLEQKLFFETRIDNLINRIIDEKMLKATNEEKAEFKNVAQILEEAKINLKNDKSFDIKNAIPIYTKINDKTAEDRICSSLIDLALDIISINKEAKEKKKR